MSEGTINTVTVEDVRYNYDLWRGWLRLITTLSAGSIVAITALLDTVPGETKALGALQWAIILFAGAIISSISTFGFLIAMRMISQSKTGTVSVGLTGVFFLFGIGSLLIFIAAVVQLTIFAIANLPQGATSVG